MKEKDKSYCEFCGNLIPEDDENQWWFLVDGVTKHYCSYCEDYMNNVQRITNKRIDYCKRNNKYYEPEKVIKMVESYFKNKNGNINISFVNNGQYGEDAINAPITKDGIAIGVITDVNKDKVKGYIWENYMPIVTELHEGVVHSFEIVC